MKAVWKMEFRRLFHNKGLYFSLAVGDFGCVAFYKRGCDASGV